MKFRAIAINITEDGHPIQNLSQIESDIVDWAMKTVAKYNCEVIIYQYIEQQIGLVDRNGVIHQ